MPKIHTQEFDTAVFKGKAEFNTGLFIDGKWVDGSDGKTIDVINPTTGKTVVQVSLGSPKDVDKAVAAARKAFETVWGTKTPGFERSHLLFKLAELMEQHSDRLAALEALDNGKTFGWAKGTDVAFATNTIRYYAGWADKNHGQTIETTDDKLGYTRHEPVGVVGQIIPWNFPLLMLSWKLGPALATGNTIVLKPSEFTPLTALYMTTLINEAGFPPGVVNIVNGYGQDVGQTIAEHLDIDKIAFTGSTLVGRKIMEAAARTNLKNVTLELGGKSPNVIFDDADLDEAVNWAAHGIFWNHGQACCAGSRIFVHEKIYDEFLKRFVAKTKSIKVGDPFEHDSYQGPQVSQQQYDRIMSYIDSGKEQGATVTLGGKRVGNEGYFIEPTIFTDTRPDMKIVQEEIFGPVGVVIKFHDDEDVIRQANETVYGLAAAVFSRDVTRALSVAHRLHAGTTWVNCANMLHPQIPFGGFKQSGIGRELGEYALANYTNVKAVHVNLGHKI
ncbi:aldehyde dehydrogenase [Punctularia strigosozonata HHB-11173 SS5]|uniref:Aldehyde dehydrogenase n=1 Tax=Punctularia strigosozonata (strain HHB-11173) TaxID=741275 RepID=R7RZC4_PUNST|nr:aldehyde dehydrogenase [Punctularia strigosozonata HHB-11173 SS5]EIN03470.1 aldehyde dehydrogenase [Punctularia strigosozonata HHB-11173 SS5]